MPTYIINLIIVLIVIFAISLSNLERKKKNTFLILFVSIQIIFLQTFKDFRSLPDIELYVNAFKYISRDDSQYIIAVTYYKMFYGYYMLNKAISLISKDIYFFTFIIGCIISLPYIIVIKKYSSIIWFSLILYFLGFIQSTFVLRQYTASSLCIISTMLLLDKKKILAIMLWCLSLTIHPTAIIYILVFLVDKIKLNINFVLFLIILIVGLYFSTPFLSTIFTENIAGYELYNEQKNPMSYTTGLIHTSILIAFLCTVKLSTLNKNEILFFKILCLTFSLSIISIFIKYADFVPRLIQYFVFAEIILIPLIIKNIRNKGLKNIAYVLIFIFYFYLHVLSNNSHALNFKLSF